MHAMAKNRQKIASLWRFELDAKSGPLEAGDFGNFSENRQRAGDNGYKPLYRHYCQASCDFLQNRQPPRGHFWHPI